MQKKAQKQVNRELHSQNLNKDKTVKDEGLEDEEYSWDSDFD